MSFHHTEPADAFNPSSDNASESKPWWQSESSNIWRVITPVRGQIILAITLSALAALCVLAALLSLLWSLQAIEQSPQSWPVVPMAGAIGLTIAGYVLRLTSFQQSHLASFRLERILRVQLIQHCAQLPTGRLQSMGVGPLSKLIQDDVKSLHLFVADSTPMYAKAIVAPVITFAILCWLNWAMAIAALAVLFTGAGVMRYARSNADNMYQQYHQTREQVSSAVIEFVQAMPVIRTFDSSSETFSRYQKALNAWRDVLIQWYRQAGFSARFSMALLNPLPTLLVLLWLSLFFFPQLATSWTAWVGVLLLVSGMAEAVMPLMALSQLVAQTHMSVARIAAFLREPVPEEPATGIVPQGSDIRFERVSFRYHDDQTQQTLDQISFSVPAGSVVALAGPSGAGKTTVIRLLLKHWPVTEGRILIGGVDIHDMTTDVLMDQISFVFQDNFLFADTIANNIRLGAPDMPMSAVIEAATAAQAHEFISELPDGYDTVVGERGASLSGGQRQRVAIARALLQDRPILVLDEPTAFADPQNEAALILALSTLMAGKTVLMVAHRLSLIAGADQILVFSDGRLSQSGQHAQLVQQPGLYADLWQQYQAVSQWQISRTARPQCAQPVLALKESAPGETAPDKEDQLKGQAPLTPAAPKTTAEEK